MASGSELNRNDLRDADFDAIRKRAEKVLQRKAKPAPPPVDYSDPHWWERHKKSEKAKRATIKDKWPWASTRVRNAFLHLDIQTDEDIKAAWLRGDFYNIHNLGKKSIKEIQEAMGFDAAQKTCPCCGQVVKGR